MGIIIVHKDHQDLQTVLWRSLRLSTNFLALSHGFVIIVHAAKFPGSRAIMHANWTDPGYPAELPPGDEPAFLSFRHQKLSQG
jgi:hypothetical protein